MSLPRLEPGVFELQIEGDGLINDTAFWTMGTGRGDTRTGDLAFQVTFSELAEGADPLANVLSSLILPTGLFGREVDGALSLLTLAGGEFSFRQRLAGEGVAAESTGVLVRGTSSRGLVWRSQAKGRVKLRHVSEIRPVRVVMIPSGPGRLIETIQWSVVDQGKDKVFHAVRDFTFNPAAELPGPQFRDVVVRHRSEGRQVSLQINSTILPFPVLQSNDG